MKFKSRINLQSWHFFYQLDNLKGEDRLYCIAVQNKIKAAALLIFIRKILLKL